MNDEQKGEGKVDSAFAETYVTALAPFAIPGIVMFAISAVILPFLFCARCCCQRQCCKPRKTLSDYTFCEKVAATPASAAESVFPSCWLPHRTRPHAGDTDGAVQRLCVHVLPHGNRRRDERRCCGPPPPPSRRPMSEYARGFVC